MSQRIRDLSARPSIVVDEWLRRIADPTGSTVGLPGPFGRERVVTALPTNGDGPRQMLAPLLLHDNTTFLVGDPTGAVIGVQGVWVHRIVSARWTEDTRRLAG